MSKTTVLYWIPGDGDEEDEPNFFSLNMDPKSVTVGDIMKNFPLGGDGFHFRFKCKYTSTFIWRDPPANLGVAPPRYDGGIVLKVTRLDAEAGVTAAMPGAGTAVAAAHERAAARPPPVINGTRASSVRRNSRDDLAIDYRRPSLESPVGSPRSRRQSIKKGMAEGGMAQDDLLNMGSLDEPAQKQQAQEGAGGSFDLLGLR